MMIILSRLFAGFAAGVQFERAWNLSGFVVVSHLKNVIGLENNQKIMAQGSHSSLTNSTRRRNDIGRIIGEAAKACLNFEGD